MEPLIKKTIVYSSLLFFLILQTTGSAFSQSRTTDRGPEVRLGEITFKVREFKSPPSRLRMLEIYIEVLNKSRAFAVPPHSIKVVVNPKEIAFPKEASRSAFAPGQEEMTFDSSLPPNTGQVMILGFSLLDSKPESITFEIQLNPPDGEKKIVKWEGN